MIFNVATAIWLTWCSGDDFEQMMVRTERSSAMFTGTPSPGDYDLADSTYGDVDFAPNPVAKRRRAADSSITEMASRLGTRFPSFSRKWSTRGGGKTISVAETLKEPSRSRANSTRASSAAGSVRGSFERQEFPLPLTPTRSVFDGEAGNSPIAPIDVQKANNATEEEGHEAFASTPLLPPLMVDYPSHVNDDYVQSPLQSPSVAERESFSTINSPVDASQFSGLPSPPLSTKPSISSFHKQRAAGLLPASEIPPIMIASDPNDEWANKLGHANFNIHPEPYVPDTFDLSTCKQLRANWDQARCNFMKQLVRTGEHYGATSKTYKLTEEKWSQIDAQWKKNSELTVARTADAVGEENALTLSQSSVEPAPLMKLPSLNGPRSEGKFPKLEDEDIVGPMEQVAAQSQRRPSRKRNFIKFLQSMLPTGSFLGRSHSP